ncbi:MAG: hypothetical protein ACLVI4_11315 [Anaerovoracaceae bacterium]
MENRLKEILSSIARDGSLSEEAVLAAKERQKFWQNPQEPWAGWKIYLFR